MQVEDVDALKGRADPAVRVLDFDNSKPNRGTPFPTTSDPRSNTQPVVSENTGSGDKKEQQLPSAERHQEFQPKHVDPGEIFETPHELVLTNTEDQPSQSTKHHVVEDPDARDVRVANDAHHPGTGHMTAATKHKEVTSLATSQVQPNASLVSSNAHTQRNFRINTLQQSLFSVEDAEIGVKKNKLYKKLPGLISFGLDFEHPQVHLSEVLIEEEKSSVEPPGEQLQNLQVSQLSVTGQPSKYPGLQDLTVRSSELSLMRLSSQRPFLLRTTQKRLENFEQKLRTQPKLCSLNSLPISKPSSDAPNPLRNSLASRKLSTDYQNSSSGRKKQQPSQESLAEWKETATTTHMETKLPRTYSATKLLQQGHLYDSAVAKRGISKHSLKFLSMREERFMCSKQQISKNQEQKYQDCAYGQPVKGWGMTVGLVRPHKPDTHSRPTSKRESSAPRV